MAGKEKKNISELCEDAYEAFLKGRGGTATVHPALVAFGKAAVGVLQREGGEEQLAALLNKYKPSLWPQAARGCIQEVALSIDCAAGVLFYFRLYPPHDAHRELKECVKHNALKSLKALLECKDVYWDLKCLKEAYEAKEATVEAKAIIVEAIPLCQGRCSVHRRCDVTEVLDVEKRLMTEKRVAGFLDTQVRDVAEIKACREWAAAKVRSKTFAVLSEVKKQPINTKQRRDAEKLFEEELAVALKNATLQEARELEKWCSEIEPISLIPAAIASDNSELVMALLESDASHGFALGEAVRCNALKTLKELLEAKDVQWDYSHLKSASSIPRCSPEAEALILSAIPRCNGICYLGVFAGEPGNSSQDKIDKVMGFEANPEQYKFEPEAEWQEAVENVHRLREWAAQAIHKSSKCANLPATPPLAAAAPATAEPLKKK